MPEENVFEETTDPQNEETPQNDEESPEIEKLKERGIDELAKGKHHADQFIDFLKEQNKDLKEELDKRLTAEATLEEIKKNKEVQSEVSEEHTSSGLTPEDVDTLVEKKISEADEKKVFEANIKRADAKVKEVYGDKAGEFIEKKASELKLSKTYLGEIAAKSPEAFFNLIGLVINPNENVGVSSPSVNTEALSDHETVVKPGTWAYYQNIRKENKSQYFSPAVQQQMFKDRERLGEDFYK